MDDADDLRRGRKGVGIEGGEWEEREVMTAMEDVNSISFSFLSFKVPLSSTRTPLLLNE